MPGQGGGLGDGYIYLVLAQSKSPAGEVIGLFTHRDYNHISLALDADLDTLVSYNGGEGIAFPGLNRETVPGLARRAGASLLVSRLPATRHQKQIILRRLGKINQEGSAYNLLGLLFPVAWPNQMFCSQFVYRMLRLAGLHYFRKDPFQVRPMDFVDLDAQGALTLVAAYTQRGAACWPGGPPPASGVAGLGVRGAVAGGALPVVYYPYILLNRRGRSVPCTL